MYDNLRTLVEVIYNSKERFPDRNFLLFRDSSNNFKPITYSGFVDLMEDFSAALYNIGVRKGDKVGIIADNSYKWLICDMGVQSLGAADVPRGSDSTANEISYILKHSDAKYCIDEDPEEADKVMSISSETPQIKKIILQYGDINDIKNKKSGVDFFLFDELIKKGSELKQQNKEELKKIRESVKEDDLATLIYTSGTTGMPKGVMLLHKNILQNLHAMPEIVPVTEKDRWISILPVWHVFERTVEYCVMITCSSMGYSKPTAKYLLPDLAEIKPTYMVSVPRIWEALYTGIVNNVKKGSKIKSALFSFFMTIGTIYMKQKRVLLNRVPYFKKPNPFGMFFKKIWALIVIFTFFVLNFLGKILVFKKIIEKTGGCLKGPISGGGALPEYVDNFFSTININILEGYGLTETSPIVSVRSI